MRLAIQIALDCVEQLRTPSAQHTEAVRDLITGLRELDLRHSIVLWVLLSAVLEQIHERYGVPSDRRATFQSIAPSAWIAAGISAERLIECFEQDVARLIKEGEVISDGSQRIGHVLEYVDLHYGERLTLDSLAAIVGRRKVSFAAEFKGYVGMTVHDYVTQVRIRRAGELLRSEGTDAKVEAVMMVVGYRSKKNFYRQFKDYFGVTPAVYRELVARADPNAVEIGGVELPTPHAQSLFDSLLPNDEEKDHRRE